MFKLVLCLIIFFTCTFSTFGEVENLGPITQENWEVPELKVKKYDFGTPRSVSFAAQQHGLSTRVRITIDKKDFPSAIKIVRKISSYVLDDPLKIIFTESKFKAQVVSIKEKTISFAEILDELCKQAGAKWIIRDRKVLIGDFKGKGLMVSQVYNPSSKLSAELLGNEVKTFFEAKGIKFPEGSSIDVLYGSRFVMFNLPKEQQKLNKVLLANRMENQGLIAAQLIEVKEQELDEETSIDDILALPKDKLIFLNRMVNHYSITGVESSFQCGKSYLKSRSYDFSDEWHYKSFSCDINWIFDSKVGKFNFKETVEFKNGEDKLIPLNSTKDKRYFLLLSARMNLIRSNTKKLKSTALQPSGPLLMFRNKKTDKERILPPEIQDEYIKKYIKIDGEKK